MKRRIIEEVVDDVETNASGIVGSTEPEIAVDKGLCLDALPLEVLHLVCRGLTHKEVTKFRLVCRLFGTVGIEYLAEGAYLSFSLQAFQDLEALANTALSKRIRSLTFITEHLAGFSTYDEWIVSEDTYQKGRRFLRFSSEAERLEKYSAFKQPYKEIEHIIQDGIHRQSLQTFFQNSPNLKSLAMSLAMGIWNLMESGDESSYTTAFEKSFGKISLGERHHHSTVELAEVMHSVVRAGIQLERLAVGYLPIESIRESNPDFAIITNAMSSLKFLVLKLVHRPSTPTGPANLRGNFGYTEEDISRIANAADELELDLSRFVATASNLSHLRFVVGHGEEDRIVDSCLLQSLFDVRIHPEVFPGLRTLSLESVRTKGHNMKTFLLARKETLTFIRFKSVDFEDSGDGYGWNHFLQDMSTKMPKLAHFMIYGHLGDIDGSMWVFGNTCDGHSSWRTHAMDRYLRMGGPLPVDEESTSAQVPNPLVYLHAYDRHGTGSISRCFIGDPEGYRAGLIDEFEDKFWAEHFWTFNPCC
ncbi:hypothetical protein D6C87_01178 [Aureobasidium pullulans]|uniref:F-box domain-containing protein n=1 Tax=Aureobasidium pullulans TaxID=5580 RepID=A0AB38M536_AURPU|nr:hypothetical protein D6C94_02958 [Aureobasidium pullulans]THZ47755.1 hypothetical protein D6C87_01178 [Aureobasidium pullulans]